MLRKGMSFIELPMNSRAHWLHDLCNINCSLHEHVKVLSVSPPESSLAARQIYRGSQWEFSPHVFMSNSAGGVGV